MITTIIVIIIFLFHSTPEPEIIPYIFHPATWNMQINLFNTRLSNSKNKTSTIIITHICVFAYIIQRMCYNISHTQNMSHHIAHTHILPLQINRKKMRRRSQSIPYFTGMKLRLYSCYVFRNSKICCLFVFCIHSPIL